MSAGPKRHRVHVMLPASGEGGRGERTGVATAVLSDVPAAIEALSGRELVQARQVYAVATHRVTLLADPAHPITEQHYLLHGSRKLHIGFVDQERHEYTLLCGESRS